jgi:hypothetical protein
MKRISAMLSAVWMVTGIVVTAKAQGDGSELVLDVYSLEVASDVTQEKLFALWAKALKEGGGVSEQYEPVIHAVYRPLAQHPYSRLSGMGPTGLADRQGLSKPNSCRPAACVVNGVGRDGATLPA